VFCLRSLCWNSSRPGSQGRSLSNALAFGLSLAVALASAGHGPSARAAEDQKTEAPKAEGPKKDAPKKDEHPAKSETPAPAASVPATPAHQTPAHPAPAHAETGHAGTGHAPTDGHGSGHDAHNGMHPGVPKSVHFDPASPALDLGIYTFVVFLLLLVVLTKFAWKPLVEALEKRESHIAHEISEAERVHAEAKLLFAEYDKKLAASQEEVKRILEQANKDAEGVRQELLRKTEQELQDMRVRVQRDLDRAVAGSLKELADFSTNLAIDLSAKLISAQLSRQDHARLIDAMVADAVSKFDRSPSTN